MIAANDNLFDVAVAVVDHAAVTISSAVLAPAGFPESSFCDRCRYLQW